MPSNTTSGIDGNANRVNANTTRSSHPFLRLGRLD